MLPCKRTRNTKHTKGWIRLDDNIWLLKPKDKLYQWVDKLSQLLADSQTLFIIDDIIPDENLDKKRQSLLKLSL